MKIFKSLIVFMFALLFVGKVCEADTDKVKKSLSQEDREIIEYLDLLQDYDLLQEDLVVIEQYENIDKIKFLGENDE